MLKRWLQYIGNNFFVIPTFFLFVCFPFLGFSQQAEDSLSANTHLYIVEGTLIIGVENMNVEAVTVFENKPITKTNVEKTLSKNSTKKDSTKFKKRDRTSVLSKIKLVKTSIVFEKLLQSQFFETKKISSRDFITYNYNYQFWATLQKIFSLGQTFDLQSKVLKEFLPFHSIIEKQHFSIRPPPSTLF